MPGALVLDTEFNTRPFRLISAGFVRLGKHGEHRTSRYFLIKPADFVIDERSPAFKVHQISQKHAMEHGEDVKALMTWLAQVLPCSTSLVGHNVSRDIQLLKEEAVRAGFEMSVAKYLSKLPVRDTLPLAKAYGLQHLSLENVYCSLFGGRGGLPDAHNALADALYTADIYNELHDTCQQQGIQRFCTSKTM